MARIRGLLLLFVVFMVVGGALNLYAWLTESPRQPPSPPAPTVPATFEATVASISRVSRSGKFVRYDIKFANASNGQYSLSYYKDDVPEVRLSAFIGRQVSVNCMRTEDGKNQTCHRLTRMTAGSDVITD